MRLFKRNFIKPSDSSTQSHGRITNDTVAEHRERILSSGRRFKYPLQHSKHRIIWTSLFILISALVVFSLFSWWQLYKLQSTSAFMYSITEIVPLPVAKIDDTLVNYRDYLVNLRSSMHYLSTQEGVDFKTEDGQRQLKDLKVRALGQVMLEALIKRIARERGITVSDQEVDEQIQRILNQQSYAGSIDVYKKVIKEYYDLDFDQWRESIRQQLLRNRVYSAMDENATNRAREALSELKKGVKFREVAKKFPDDKARRENGGEIGLLEKGKADLAPELQEALFSLKSGETSNIVASTQGLFIFKAIEVKDSKVRAAAIFLRFRAFEKRLEDIEKQDRAAAYINVPIRLDAQN